MAGLINNAMNTPSPKGDGFSSYAWRRYPLRWRLTGRSTRSLKHYLSRHMIATTRQAARGAIVPPIREGLGHRGPAYTPATCRAGSRSRLAYGCILPCRKASKRTSTMPHRERTSPAFRRRGPSRSILRRRSPLTYSPACAIPCAESRPSDSARGRARAGATARPDAAVCHPFSAVPPCAGNAAISPGRCGKAQLFI